MARHVGGLKDDDVLRLRRAFAAPGSTMDHVSLSKTIGINIQSTLHMLTGKTFKHVDGALTKAIVKRQHERRGLNAAQIIEARARYIAEDGAYSLAQAAKGLGITTERAKKVLGGQIFEEILPYVPAHLLNRKILSDEDVVAARAIYAADPSDATVDALAEQHDLQRGYMRDVLIGVCRKNLPGAVRSPSDRALSAAEVTKYRDLFGRGIKSVTQIAHHAGLSFPTVKDMLYGYTYKDVPGAVPVGFKQKRPVRFFRKKNGEQWQARVIPVRAAIGDRPWKLHRSWSPKRWMAQHERQAA